MFQIRKLQETDFILFNSLVHISFKCYLNEDEDVNRTWENIKENVKTSAKESLGVREWKQHKPWFGEECLGFLDQRKRTKMQWVQDPSQRNVDNLNNVRRDASRYFRNKRRHISKPKLRNLKLTARSKILGPCIGASVTLRRVTSLELI